MLAILDNKADVAGFFAGSDLQGLLDNLLAKIDYKALDNLLAILDEAYVAEVGGLFLRGLICRALWTIAGDPRHLNRIFAESYLFCGSDLQGPFGQFALLRHSTTKQDFCGVSFISRV